MFLGKSSYDLTEKILFTTGSGIEINKQNLVLITFQIYCIPYFCFPVRTAKMISGRVHNLRYF